MPLGTREVVVLCFLYTGLVVMRFDLVPVYTRLFAERLQLFLARNL